MIACRPVCLHKYWVSKNILREVDAEDVLVKGKAQEDGTVVPAKWNVLPHRKNLSCLPELCFSGHTTLIIFAELDKAAEVIRAS
jgi:hypothetical protein